MAKSERYFRGNEDESAFYDQTVANLKEREKEAEDEKASAGGLAGIRGIENDGAGTGGSVGSGAGSNGGGSGGGLRTGLAEPYSGDGEYSGGGESGDEGEDKPSAAERGAEMAEDAKDIAKGVKAGAEIYAGKVTPENVKEVAKAVPKIRKFTSKIMIALPLVVIFGVVLIVIGVILAAQSMLPGAYTARIREEFNKSGTVNHDRSDQMLEVALQADNRSGESDVVGETIFSGDSFTLSAEQMLELSSQGLVYSDADGTRSILYYSNGQQKAVVSDAVVESRINVIADAQDTAVEEYLAREEIRKQVLADITNKLADAETEGASPMNFSEAMEKDFDFKDRYIRDTKQWRGDISGWFVDETDMTYQRLATSRNRYKDFQEDWTFEEKTDYYKETAVSKVEPIADSPAEVESTLIKRATEIADKSTSEGSSKACALMSAVNEVNGVVAADQKYRRVNAASSALEAMDRMRAGDNGPVNEQMNAMYEKDENNESAMSSDWAAWLFGGPLPEQTSTATLNVAAQPNLVEMDYGAAGVDQETFNSCNYTEAVQSGNTNFLVAAISGVFNKVKEWFSKLKNAVASFLGGGMEQSVRALLQPVIGRMSEMSTRDYGTKTYGALYGDALVLGGKDIYDSMAVGVGMSQMDKEVAAEFAKAKVEVLAEQADYDRRNLSPFDTSSRYTFLGSVVYAMIPMAVSIMHGSSGTNLVSSAGSLASTVGSALTSLVPGAVAIGNLEVTDGDCVFTESIGSATNPTCTANFGSDMSTITADPQTVMNKVASLRLDDRTKVTANSATSIASSNELINGENCEGTFTERTNCLKEHLEDGTRSGYTFRNDIDTDSDYYRKEGLDDSWDCETDWAIGSYTIRVLTGYDSNGNPTYTERTILYYKNGLARPDGVIAEHEPVEWSYDRPTNFKFEGMKDGLPAHDEDEINTQSTCRLIVKKNNKKNPVVNINSALGQYLVFNGQRISTLGEADEDILEKVKNTILVHGTEGTTDKHEKDKEVMSRAGSVAYTATKNQSGEFGTADLVELEDYKLGDKHIKSYWQDENIWYERYAEDQQWLVSAGVLNKSAPAVALTDYYKENPLDQTYEGILARYSGKTREHVVAILDFIDYAVWLYNYDPVAFGPAKFPEKFDLAHLGEWILERVTGLVFDFRDDSMIQMENALIAAASEFQRNITLTQNERTIY